MLTSREVTDDPVSAHYALDVVTTTGVEPMELTPDDVLSLDDFYWVPLTEDDIDSFPGIFTIYGLPDEDNSVEAGDFALLVAMHVATGEWDPFTWQTFYWTPNPSGVPPDVPSPWNRFNVEQAYYYVNEDGSPLIAFSPHLETPLEGNPPFMDPSTMKGSESNCLRPRSGRLV